MRRICVVGERAVGGKANRIRYQHVFDRYRQLGRFEADRRPTDVNDLICDVLDARGASNDSGIVIREDLTTGLPEAVIDADLVTIAVENLLQNACEAMNNRGTVTVACKYVNYLQRE